MLKKNFPDGFYWGAATSAFQVEGNIKKMDWEKAAEDGRVPRIGLAADHYNRYESDFDIAKSLGHNAHRFSIEWARIEPEEGKFDQSEVEHYRQVIRSLQARNLRPFTTLWHFTLPLWFAERGGFEHADAPLIFARYAGFIARELGGEIEGLTTINEPIVFAGLGWLKGNWPPFKQFSLVNTKNEMTYSGDRTIARPSVSFMNIFTYLRVVNNLARAHNLAYDAIKQEQPELDVSLAKHIVAYDANKNFFNKLQAWMQDNFFNHWFLRKVYRKCDSFGLNFYHYVKIGNRSVYKKTDMGWDMVPEGIYYALKTLWHYRKPIFISEAGLADANDSDRAYYIKKQVEATWQALQEGVDVRGHMYWSLMDNYELALGYEKRFGLIEINYDTLERTIRPSAYVYKEICERNTVLE